MDISAPILVNFDSGRGLAMPCGDRNQSVTDALVFDFTADFSVTGNRSVPVSYTHLTLPTILRV